MPVSPQTRKFLVPAAVSAAIALAFAAGRHAPETAWLAPAQAASVAIAPAAATPPVRTTGALPDFAALVEQQGGAVVAIAVTKAGGTAAATMPDGADDGATEEFLRRFGVPMPRGGAPGGVPGGAPQQQGMGSGFVVSADGTILTNAHVVDGASEVLVRLADRRELKARVVGLDRRSDVAVLQVDAKGLPTVKIGSPSTVRVGEWVAAIGSPFGLENTVTAGIVSAKSRNVGDDGLVPFLQTDVAVNPGNSGGPLFNLAGEVVGINSMIFSRSGGYMGVSFAIPIDVAMRVKDDLVQYGKVTRGRIGVTVQPVTQPLAETFGLDRPRGALVAGVDPEGPAARAGLRAGDVILSYGGEPIAESGDLPSRVAATKPGTAAALKVWRDGRETSLDVEVGEMPAERGAVVADAGEPKGRLGVVVRPLEPAEAKRLGADGGVRVERVGGPAAKAGVRSGDVIVGVNGKPVTTPEDLKRAVDGARDRVALLVQRGDGRLFVPVPLG
jgi:serine protease Do